MRYIDDLSRELAVVGIRGRLRQRILAEIADHLSCDPDSDLGSPGRLAEQFADELGTARARRAAFSSFTALALAGALFAAAFLTSGLTGVAWPRLHAKAPLLGDLATGLVVLGPQVAFVCGLLAALRAFRLRDRPIIERAQAAAIFRRAGIALLAGAASMAGLALVAIEFQDNVSRSWTVFALSASAVGAVALMVSAPSVLSAARLQPTLAGSAGDVFDDLGWLAPRSLRGRPWKLAVTVAAGVAAVITLAGALQSDGFDGALRGLADALACLAGFAVLGRFLGLRR
jgi:hypothetical protein